MIQNIVYKLGSNLNTWYFSSSSLSLDLSSGRYFSIKSFLRWSSVFGGFLLFPRFLLASPLSLLSISASFSITSLSYEPYCASSFYFSWSYIKLYSIWISLFSSLFLSRDSWSYFCLGFYSVFCCPFQKFNLIC